METGLTKMDASPSGSVPQYVTQHTTEESAISHDSEYDDFLGVPESITVNENGEPVSIEEITEYNCEKGEHCILNLSRFTLHVCLIFVFFLYRYAEGFTIYHNSQ